MGTQRGDTGRIGITGRHISEAHAETHRFWNQIWTLLSGIPS